MAADRTAYHRAWRAKNREKMRAYQRAWRAAHPEQIRAYTQKQAAKRKEYRKAYYAANRERLRAKHRAYYYANHAYWRAKGRAYRRTSLLKEYGLTVAQYDAMLAQQHGLCAICQRPERIHKKGKPVRLAVDHDHATGVVRGLLCHACNQAIARLEHDPVILQRAIRYLQKGTP